MLAARDLFLDVSSLHFEAVFEARVLGFFINNMSLKLTKTVTLEVLNILNMYVWYYISLYV